jgi:hypothetical protein
LYWFVRGATSADIASETGLDRKRVLRALGAVRRAMLMTNPVAPGSSRSRLVVGGRSRHATLGLYRNGALVGAEVVPDAGHETEPGRYDAVVERGRLHRVPERGERVPFGHVEAFWAFLQRHLRAKGGIRPARLTLHLAEFTWRYNHRHVTPQQQVQRLLELLQQSHRWRERDYALAVKVLSPAAARSTPRPEPGR